MVWVAPLFPVSQNAAGFINQFSLNIENVITNLDDRSSILEFAGNVKGRCQIIPDNVIDQLNCGHTRHQ